MPLQRDPATTETPWGAVDRTPLESASRTKGKKPVGAMLERPETVASEVIMSPAASARASVLISEKDETSLFAKSVNTIQPDLAQTENPREAIQESELLSLCKEREDDTCNERNTSDEGPNSGATKHDSMKTVSDDLPQRKRDHDTKKRKKVRTHIDKAGWITSSRPCHLHNREI